MTAIDNTDIINRKKIQLDNSCKKILSEKQILARIMKRCTKEFYNLSIENIIADCISPQMDVNIIDDNNPGVITGSSQEEVTLPNTQNFYDIKFDASLPSNNKAVQLIMNIEAQNRSYLTYNVAKRGIFYGSTLIAGQYGTVFTKSHYELIRKVYSIWICTKPHKADRASITSFSIHKDTHLGSFNASKEQFDLMEVVIICLPTKPNSTDDALLDMLGTMFSYGYSDKKIKSELKKKFNIQLTPTLAEEVNSMCNLGNEIYDSGVNKGISQGISQGEFSATLSSIRNLMDSLNIDVNVAMKLLKIPDDMIDKFTTCIKESSEQYV